MPQFKLLSISQIKALCGMKSGHALKLDKFRKEQTEAVAGGGGRTAGGRRTGSAPSIEEVQAWSCEDVCAWLSSLQLPPAVIEKFRANEVDSEELLDPQMTGEELLDQVGITKLSHRNKVLKGMQAIPCLADQGSGCAPTTGEPVGSVLDDGSTVSLVHRPDGSRDILGRGGSGVVYVGLMTRRSGTSVRVACKSLIAGSSEREVQRFVKEYEVQRRASQTCTGAVRTFGCCTIDGSLHLIMKLYERDLRKLLDEHIDPSTNKRLPLPPRRAFEFALQISVSLQELHGQGIVVRDLKPSNLLLDADEKLVVSDFGIAGLLEETTGIASTKTAAGQGTPQYMSPEQFDSDNYGPIKEPTDIWALACIMVEMLTGEPPWPHGHKYPQIMTDILMKSKTPELPVAVSVPARVRDLLKRCVLLDQTGRPKASEIASVLRELMATMESTSAQPMLDPNRPTRTLLCAVDSSAYTHADSLLRSSWAKRDMYEFLRLIEVKEVDNPRLHRRYEQYKQGLPEHGNEQLVFHGCSEGVVESLVEQGLL